jgi:hypothetical protein
MSQEGYIPGSCNLGEGEIGRRKMVAAIGFVLSLSAFTAFITNDASRQTRLGIFIPLLVMSVGWVQSRKKFCLAYGLTGTFNFGKMGQISRVADPADRAADRRTALTIFAQSALYAAALTLLVVALPL